MAALLFSGALHGRESRTTISENINVEEQTYDIFSALSKDLRQTEGWEPGKSKMFMPLCDLVARARSYLPSPAMRKQVMLPVALDWRTRYLRAPDHWVLEVRFRPSPRLGASKAENPREVSVWVLPNGGEVTLQRRPLTDAELESIHEKKKSDGVRPPSILGGMPTPPPEGGSFVFSTLQNLEARTVETYEGNSADFEWTSGWKLDEEDLKTPLSELIAVARSRIPQEYWLKDYVVRLVGVDWRRHHDGSRPTWIGAVHFELHYDYEHKPPGTIGPRGGDTYRDLLLFPNGGEVSVTSRKMTDDELGKLGLPPL